MTGDTGDGAAVLDRETRDDALDVLRDALQWRLADQRWAAIRAAVDALRAAVRAGDADGARSAVAELELLGPVRATPVGRAPTVPPPDPVREEINELVHTLDGSTEPSP